MYSKIRALCKEKKITISTLEKELGFGSGTISHWKTSKGNLENVLKVSQKLGVTVEFLVGIPNNNLEKTRIEKIISKISKLNNKEIDQLEIFLEVLGDKK